MSLREKKSEVVIGTIIFYIIHIFLHKFAIAGNNLLFPYSCANSTMTYWLQITPEESTFIIWDFTYVLQLISMVYTWVMIIRGEEVANILSVHVFVWFSVYLFFMTSWFFLWSRHNTIATFVVIVLAQVALDITMGYACYDLYHYIQKYPYPMNKIAIWCQWMLVQNSLIFHVTWNTFIVILQVCVVIAYEIESTTQQASLIGLSLIACLVIFWFYMENIVMKDYVKYTFSNYIVLIVALCGILGSDVWRGIHITLVDEVVIVLLVVILVLFLIRVIVLTRYFENDNEDYEEERNRLLVTKLMYT